MDGAIVVDQNVNQILKANVHLNPSDEIDTSQTGTRHRTAHRVSVDYFSYILVLLFEYFIYSNVTVLFYY